MREKKKRNTTLLREDSLYAKPILTYSLVYVCVCVSASTGNCAIELSIESSSVARMYNKYAIFFFKFLNAHKKISQRNTNARCFFSLSLSSSPRHAKWFSLQWFWNLTMACSNWFCVIIEWLAGNSDNWTERFIALITFQH